MGKAPFYVRPLAKKGKALAKKPKASSGFDYPAQAVGSSKWKGSDGQPVNVFVDPSTGASGQAAAQNVLTQIDTLMAAFDAVFGVQGQGGNVIVCPDFGGAYHYGCDFSNGGDWYESNEGTDVVVGLAVAEIVESYMGLQSKGWNCGGSGGEALSRVLAEIATGGANGAMVDYAAGTSWDGSDWISRDQGTDGDYPSIGCGVLYLWWMISQGFSIQAIVQAGEPDGTLSTNYAALTGKPSTQAFNDFKNAVQKAGGPSSDNPFNAPNPAWPTGPGPSPGPGPIPTPTPTPGPAAAQIVVNQDVAAGSYDLITADQKKAIHGLLDQIAAALPSDSLAVVPVELRAALAARHLSFGTLFTIIAMLIAFIDKGDFSPAALTQLLSAIMGLLGGVA